MNRSLLSLCCLDIVLCSAGAEAQDFVGGMEPIGPVNSFRKDASSVTFTCQIGRAHV
jgi:hypothetical protein